MKLPSPIPFLLALILTFSLTGYSNGSERDQTINVKDDDADMAAAIAKARATLSQFWEVFDHSERGESGFALKVRITDSSGIEHFWALDIERQGEKIFGTIDNDPNIVTSVKLGDRIQIPEADITDWLYVRDGKMVGNYTLRALFKSMPADEAEAYRQMMAEL